MKHSIGTAILIGVSIFLVYLTFRNPDMTDMHLFLTYWKEYAICMVLAIIGGVLREL